MVKLNRTDPATKTVFKQESHHLNGSSYDYDEGSDIIIFNYFDSINSLAKIFKIGTNGSDFKSIYSDFAMHADWITSKWKIRIKSLAQDDGDAQIVVKGPVYLSSWYFD